MLKEQAFAKLNLTLGVLAKRPDGYHTLDSLMVSVSLFDELILEKDRGVAVTVEGAALPPENTMVKAARLYKEKTGRGAVIHCKKRIPSEAGMGGGSSDAAAVLRGMQKLYRMATEDELYEMALQVGADVPFCLKGGLCRCEGIGEILTPLPCPTLHFAVLKPARGVSTGQLFRALTLPRKRVQTVRAMELLATGKSEEAAPYMENALEEPAESLVPEISEARNGLISAGALAARMTGSGSAVFGLFKTREAAEAAVEKLGSAFPFAAYCHSVSSAKILNGGSIGV